MAEVCRGDMEAVLNEIDVACALQLSVPWLGVQDWGIVAKFSG